MSLVTLPESKFVPGSEGLYDLESSLYHDHAKAPGIKRTVLVELMQISPAHALSTINGSFKKVPTKEMLSGTLADIALLEPSKFQEGLSHWTIPEGMKLNTKEGIAWKKDHPDLPYLPAETDAGTTASAKDIQGMIASCMSHKKARPIIEAAKKQESAFCFDPNTGLLRKVRPDCRMEDNHSRLVLIDLKTTFRGGACEGAFQRGCANKAYHIQDAYYSDVYKDLVGEAPFFLFIVVERKPPYACRVFQIDQEGKEFARNKYRAALDTFKRCQETGIWPSYKEEIKTISLPRWELNAPEPDI